MNTKKVCVVAGLAMILVAGSALAAEDEEFEGTIRLMGAAEAELPGAVTKEIKLPDGVSEDESTHPSAYGMETANTARERREAGLTIADGASADARENAADMAETAQENAESLRGIPDDLPIPPLPGG